VDCTRKSKTLSVFILVFSTAAIGALNIQGEHVYAAQDIQLGLRTFDQGPLGLENGTDAGFILYTPMFSFDTYLINRNGTVINTWQSDYLPGLSAYNLPNGDILRPKRLNLEQGGSGGIEEFSPDGQLIWDYIYYSFNNYTTHHDICPMPNGNVLALSYVYLSYSELIDLGRDPSITPAGGMKLEKIIEVNPIGPTSGKIVWTWDSRDHLIQDFIPEKPNYGVVGNHPELLDINYVDGSDDDLFHCNSIDYNEYTDQILVSSRNFNEVWIVNHSNGYLMYRFGNPAAYHGPGSQVFYWQHDATWIIQDGKSEGDVLVFNNGVGRGFTTIDEINTAMNHLVWSYTYPGFFIPMFGGAQRLKSGNTLIDDTSKFYEVTPQQDVVWQYAPPNGNNIFKIDFILPSENQVDCQGSISQTKVTPGTSIIGSFVVHDKSQYPLYWQISDYPEWGVWHFNALSGITTN